MDANFLYALKNVKEKLDAISNDGYQLETDGDYLMMAHELYAKFSKLATRYGTTTEIFLKLLHVGAIPDDILEHLQDEEFWK